MRTLETQIRQLAEIADEAMPWIDLDEIQSPDAVRVVPPPFDEPTRPVHKVVIFAATFVLVLTLVGGVAWLVPSGDDVPPANEPTVTTTVPNEPTVTTTVPTDAVELAVLSLTIGPEPRFDPSALGREVVFEPAEDDDISEQVSQLIFDSLPPGYEYPIPVDLESLEGRLIAHITDPDAANAATLAGPIQYVGHMTDNGQHLIVWEIDDGLGLSVLPSGASSCCGGTSEDYGMWLGAGDGSTAEIVVAVPPETSVVGITEPDGTRLWQRPIGGWGMFEVAVWPDGSPGPTIDAYDILGDQIGHWTIGSQTGETDN